MRNACAPRPDALGATHASSVSEVAVAATTIGPSDPCSSYVEWGAMWPKAQRVSEPLVKEWPATRTSVPPRSGPVEGEMSGAPCCAKATNGRPLVYCCPLSVSASSCVAAARNCSGEWHAARPAGRSDAGTVAAVAPPPSLKRQRASTLAARCEPLRMTRVSPSTGPDDGLMAASSAGGVAANGAQSSE